MRKRKKGLNLLKKKKRKKEKEMEEQRKKIVVSARGWEWVGIWKHFIYLLLLSPKFIVSLKNILKGPLSPNPNGEKKYILIQAILAVIVYGEEKKNLIFKQKKRFPIINSLGISWNMHILKNKKSWNILRSLSLHLQTGVLSSNFDPD